MTTGVPLPEPDYRHWETNQWGHAVQEPTSAYTADQMREYAAAECAPLMNEIEALRQDGSRLAANNKSLREALLEIIESPSVWDHYSIARAAIRERGASMTNEDITNNKPDQPAVWINYIMLHSFASEYKVPYNELCRVVRAAVARLDLSEEHQ